MPCTRCGGKTYSREIDYGVDGKKWVNTCIVCDYGDFIPSPKDEAEEAMLRIEEADLYQKRDEQEAAKE